MKGVVHSREVYKDANCKETLVAESVVHVLGEMCSSLFAPVIYCRYSLILLACFCMLWSLFVLVCVCVCVCVCVTTLIDRGGGGRYLKNTI